MQLIPSEFTMGEVYFPPLLIASVLGIVMAWLSGRVLNRYRLSRFFFYPPLVLLALDRVLDRPSWRGAALLGLLLGVTAGAAALVEEFFWVVLFATLVAAAIAFFWHRRGD